MSDTISRQAAIDKAVPLNLFGREVMMVSVSELENLPSAQPEIIRCKDCEYWREDHTCREHSLVSPMAANEFCSRAERREE